MASINTEECLDQQENLLYRAAQTTDTTTLGTPQSMGISGNLCVTKQRTNNPEQPSDFRRYKQKSPMQAYYTNFDLPTPEEYARYSAQPIPDRRRVLSDADVLEARREYATGRIGVKALAEKYRVGKTTMRACLLGETHKHLPGAVAVFTHAKRRVVTKLDVQRACGERHVLEHAVQTYYATVLDQTRGLQWNLSAMYEYAHQQQWNRSTIAAVRRMLIRCYGRVGDRLLPTTV